MIVLFIFFSVCGLASYLALGWTNFIWICCAMVFLSFLCLCVAFYKKYDELQKRRIEEEIKFLEKQNQKEFNKIQRIINGFDYGERKIFDDLQINHNKCFDNNDIFVKSLVEKGVIERIIKRTPEHDMKYSLYCIAPQFIHIDI
jgi:predicted ferric reductase